jgi:hypothetical protein
MRANSLSSGRVSHKPLGGVSVEQVAGVDAAIALGFPLSEVLAQEQIASDIWSEASAQWKEALAKDPVLAEAYATKRREADECLHSASERPAEGPPPWAVMLGAVASAPDIDGILRAMALTPNDLVRLGLDGKPLTQIRRHFVRELTSTVGPPPKVSPKLVRFPWSPPPESAPRPDVPTPSRLATPVEGVLPLRIDLDLYAAMTVIIELAPHAEEAALALCGTTPSEYAQIGAVWSERLRSPELRAAFTVKQLDHRAAVERVLRGATPIIE